MRKTLEVSHISVSVERAPDDVYRFASNIEGWSRWTAGLRVLPNGTGSEIVFSVFRQPDTSADAHRRDTAAVARDLQTLKGLIEN